VHTSFSDGPTEDLKNMLDLNVLGLSVCTQEALACMKQRGVDDGHIIHINRLVVLSLAVKERNTYKLVTVLGFSPRSFH
jgi:NADP-dependent 3-hydroxy acid dehydrogenase YdfG